MGADEKQLSIRSGMFMIVVGLGASGYFGWVLFLQLQAAAWPTTHACVVTSHVEVQTTVSAKRGIRDMYLGKVAFQYSVAGQTHESSE